MANLHLVTGHTGHAHVTAADQGSWNVATFGSGSYILNRGSQWGISVISNNQVRIADGDILLQGRHIRLNENSYVDLAVENGVQGTNRNDLIVCRYTFDSGTGVEEANLVVIKGDGASGTADDPEYYTGDLVGGAEVVDMPLYRIPIAGLNIGTPVRLFDDPVESFEEHKNDSSIHTTVNDYTVSVPASWAEDTTNGGYKQTVAVADILATDNPIYDVVLGADTDANELYIEAFYQVTRLTTENGKITLWANVEKPAVSFSIRLKVIR